MSDEKSKFGYMLKEMIPEEIVQRKIFAELMNLRPMLLKFRTSPRRHTEANNPGRKYEFDMMVACKYVTVQEVRKKVAAWLRWPIEEVELIMKF